MSDKDKQEDGPFTEGFFTVERVTKPKPDANDERVGSLLRAIDEYTEKQRGKRK